MRLALVVRGTVQGVGFRPFVRRAAIERALVGFVKNGRGAVRIEVQGDEKSVASFTHALEHDLPLPAAIDTIDRSLVADRSDARSFDIYDSSGTDALIASHDRAIDRGGADVFVSEAVAPVLPPDLATCEACWKETRTIGHRRHRYPFTNCASCGPRYSIVTGLPYDRRRTSMQAFAMCETCASEYGDIEDRRYHAQPIACPTCGPSLTWLDARGQVSARDEDALRAALSVLRRGGVIAVRGLGGFQLLCDATRSDAVCRLRERKRRPHKPFAVLFRDDVVLASYSVLSEEERFVLRSPEAPIVLVARRAGSPLASEVAPGSPWIGAMLPNTPLHGLLAGGASVPLICTSGNLSQEPMCTTTEDALERLSEIADGFLTHDRAIVRPLDDSLVRVRASMNRPNALKSARLTSPKTNAKAKTVILRRARGYAPRGVGNVDPRVCVLAVGAHLKSTITLAHNGVLVPSQHLGDLDAPRTRDLMRIVIDDLCTFFDARPTLIACDMHPDYASTLIAERLASDWSTPLLRVQHHHAHIAACIAEHDEERGHDDNGDKDDDAVLGLAWDGAGLGEDGTIWGGEALILRQGHPTTFERFAHLRSSPLLGGDHASRDPRRAALGLLFEALPSEVEHAAAGWFASPKDLSLHLRALELRVNAPMCSSIGRLFDAVAALVCDSGPMTFEGQAAMALENLAAGGAPSDGAYALPLIGGLSSEMPLIADTTPLLIEVLGDLRRRVEKERIARRFHESLVELAMAIAERAGIKRIVLGGGCFQNRLLTDRIEARLVAAGFTVLSPASVPSNDGGISVGQAWIAAHQLASLL